MEGLVQRPTISEILKPVDSTDKVINKADAYLKYYDQNGNDTAAKARKENSLALSNNYYDLATDFYEYGWGDGFHFAPLRKGESRDHSFAKYEYHLALKLGLQPGMKCLDVGCGIGGPARHIAIFSGASIIGINSNKYQLQRCHSLTRGTKLDQLCSYIEGDFNNIPMENNTVDAAYAIEATCHADDLSKVYGEVFRVLKPGGRFAFYEWVVTDKYDKTDKQHVKVKNDILEGAGVPELETPGSVLAALRKVGFNIVESRDCALESPIPWYSILEGRWTLSDVKSTTPGRFMTHCMLYGLEMFRLSPRGSVKVHRMLCKGADGCIAGGRLGIFSPMFLSVAEKPK